MKQIIRTGTVKIVFVSILIALVLVGLAAFQQTPPDLQVKGFLDGDQKIAYEGGSVYQTQGRYYATALWHGHHITREEIEQYVTASNQAGQDLLKQGIKKFYVGVTLRRYISPEEFEGLVSSTGAEAKNYMLRATFPKIDPSVRVGLAGFPGADSLINPKAIENVQASLKYQAKERKADQIASARTSNPEDSKDWQDVLTDDEFKAIQVADDDAVLNGVFTFEAITDAEGYQQLRQNPLVYHVDVTGTVVFQQLKDRGVKWSDFAQDLDLSDYDTFVDMETLGLESFQ